MLTAACKSGRTSARGALTIAVVPKGTSHVFWKSIHAGAAKAAKELGVAIVLAPLDEAALADRHGVEHRRRGRAQPLEIPVVPPVRAALRL